MGDIVRELRPHEARLVDEVRQLDTRIKSLRRIIYEWDILRFTPECEKEQLEKQLKAMEAYLTALLERTDVKKLIIKGVVV